MCGRTCLTLEPQQVQCACKYKTKTIQQSNNNKSEDNGNNINSEPIKKENIAVDFITPEFRSEFNCGRSYTPSYNIAPTDITPVLVSNDHFRDAKSENAINEIPQRVIVPMMWGMIPFWHKGDYRKHGLTTNNCRLEHMLDSKMYRGPFRRGQRCVVLCEGFYEWQTTKTAKPSERAAHLLYMPQDENIKIYDKTTWTPNNVQLLKMAGLFDVWEDEHGDKMYSYSIITFESSEIMSWLHHRMPAILETDEQVNNWLNYKHVTDEEALATLRPATQLKWHRVTNMVNNSRNKSEECNKPFELAEKPKKPPMNKIMSSWLNIRKERELALNHNLNDIDDDDPQTRKRKMNIEGIEDDDTDEALPCTTAKRQRYRDYKRQICSTSSSSTSESANEIKSPSV